MSHERLTPDNFHYSALSKPQMALQETERYAVNCTNVSFLHVRGGGGQIDASNRIEAVRDLVGASRSASTRLAYESDLKHFKVWGGTLPSSPAMVAAYIAAHADTLAVATIIRRIATLSQAHEAHGENPCRTALVRATLQGLRRKCGTAQQQAKPLLREDLVLALDGMGSTAKDVRDRALLLIGFAGGFRRSELVGLDRADIEHVRHGVIVTLRRSKTDQEAAGRKIGIPYGRTRHCPIAALDTWLMELEIGGDSVFRPVDRHGNVKRERLSGDAVSHVIRERIAVVGIDPTGFSGHSLRAGFVTSAIQAGVPTWKIRKQTGHASDSTLARYIRLGELFSENAAAVLL